MLSLVAALPALHNAMRMEEIKAYVTSPVRYDAATRPTLQLAQDAAAATGACLTTTPPPEAVYTQFYVRHAQFCAKSSQFSEHSIHSLRSSASRP